MEPGTRNPERLPGYSPSHRTAVVFCGTGAHGAYHAGVLRALQEAGVKIDLVAGHGVGAGTALLAAIDGGARLWDANGLWRGGAAARFYGWKPLVAAVGWIAALLVAVLTLPLIVLAIGMVVFAVGFLLTLVGIGSVGARLTAFASTSLQAAFSSEHLPTIVPRLAMVVVAVLVVVAACGVLVARWRAPVQRRAEGAWWWRLVGAPLDVERIRACQANFTVNAGSLTLPSSGSIGILVIELPSSAHDIETLLKRADEAMYESKRATKSRAASKEQAA